MTLQGVNTLKRRLISAVLCLMLIVSMFAMPVTAYAKTSKIMKVNTGSNLRDPDDYQHIVGHVKKGTKVLWNGKTKKAFCLVTTSSGKTGYIYKGYLNEYGAVNTSQVYVTKSSCRIYKKNSTSSKSVAKLSKGKYVLVYATQKGWAYVKTTSGKGGFMKTSDLRKY